jgi:hypothetical protein
VCIAVVIGLVIFAGSDDNSDRPNLVDGNAQPNQYVSHIYKLDEWKNDLEDGKKEYYVSFVMYSKDYYANPTINHIKYHKDGKYERLIDVFPDAKIELFDVNTTQNGICTYAKVKTSQLIDIKSVHVLLEGPAKYDSEALTKEAYVNKYGSTKGWIATMVRVSEKTANHSDLAELQTDFYRGVCRVSDFKSSQFYYESGNYAPVIKDNKILSKVDVVPIKNCEISAMADAILYSTAFYNIVDGVATEAKLDERLRVVSQEIDGELWVGFETIDGSNMSDYDGEIPDVIAYINLKTCYFQVNQIPTK